MTWIIAINGKKIGTLQKYDPNDEDKIKDYICNKYRPMGRSLQGWVTPEEIEIIEKKEWYERR